jgi:type I restriction-modification system DNA methylase subunit
MGSPSEIRSILEQFVEDLDDKLSTQRLEEVLRGDDTPKEAELGSQPEPWTRRHLIRPLIEAADLYWEPELHGGGEGYPDFGITNLDTKVIGEDKALNKSTEADEDIEEYLNNRAASQGAEYGIATDGITWAVIRIELGGDYLDYDRIEPTPINFREEILKIAAENTSIGYSPVTESNVDEKAEQFYETFGRDNFNQLLTQEAPKQIRHRKQAGIEEFYDLYIQLLFGEGSRNYNYETTLIDTIKAPDNASEADKRKFAIKLVNRLLFVKFLEDNEVMPENFLTERVEKYQEAQDIDQITGGLYKSQLQPIFFSLFNTEKDDRIYKHKGGWFDDVEYLNGSLFAPSDNEREYDVDDPMLITVVIDLIEGHKLEQENDGGLDPSILGQVFEMTINHINSGQSQKDEGAYYTPSDVIQLINEETVDPKVYEILVDAYSTKMVEASSMDEETARELVSDYNLGEMLREIEQRQGYFSDPEALREAYERLGKLKVIDPACGSGHFLTGVMDEIHRVRMSLLRGMEGDDIEDAEIYQSKKDLVLQSIYGVDINPIAIEIAKLRVWLKMVEDGWEQDYGELPNIDINIVPGNSLIGLPARSEGQSVLSAFDLNISAFRDIRAQYKDGEITRRQLNSRLERLRPELKQHYAEQLNHYIEERITEESDWSRLTAGLSEIYPDIRKVTIRRTDGDELSNTQKTDLDDAGFRVEPRYGKSAKVEEEDIENVNDFARFLGNGLLFDLERQPGISALDELEGLSKIPENPNLAYEPFHWPVQFPEAAKEKENGGGYEVGFDLVVGNPPYGDVQSDVEKQFTDGYKTGNVNDVIAPFIERQGQILKTGGYFGNIAALLFAYQSSASSIRKVIRNNLADAKVACFTRRPSQVFAGSQARTGIITAKKTEEGDDKSVETSKFLRFTEDNRREVFNNIEYAPTEGFTLGEKIGEDGDYSLPKIGGEEVANILQKLKDHSDTVFRDKMTRDNSRSTQHVVWRSYHPAYFMNPFVEDLYPDGEQSRDFKPMYFNSELEQKTAFLIMQSSLFYMYWMVYENERDLNWKSVDAFPFPDQEDLEERENEIGELADELWEEMEDRFLGNIRETFDTISVIKPMTDKADELIGPMFDLTEEEIEYAKQYDEEYRLSDVNQTQLVDVDFELEDREEGESEEFEG